MMANIGGDIGQEAGYPVLRQSRLTEPQHAIISANIPQKRPVGFDVDRPEPAAENDRTGSMATWSRHIQTSYQDYDRRQYSGYRHQPRTSRGRRHPQLEFEENCTQPINLEGDPTSLLNESLPREDQFRQNSEVEPELLLQPETRPISHEELVVEVKGI